MTGLMLCVALVAGVVPEESASPKQPISYSDAYAEANKTKKPMLVLVGADWCPACRVMKYNTLPQLIEDGKLQDVSYSIVDVDDSPRLSSQLMQSRSIPQLLLMVPLADGWHRVYLQGSQHPDTIETMIRDGLEEQKQNLAAAKKKASSMPVATNP